MHLAVDAHVAGHLVERCIGGGRASGQHSGALMAGRSRILCTHSLQFLPLADRVAVLRGGALVEWGTYDELLKGGTDFAALVAARDRTAAAVEEARGAGAGAAGGAAPAPEELAEGAKNKGADLAGEDADEDEEDGGPGRDEPTPVPGALPSKARGASTPAPGQAEDRTKDVKKSGAVGGETYRASRRRRRLRRRRPRVLARVALALTLAAQVLTALFGLRAATNLHTRAFHQVMRARMVFFERTPAGRVMNRFSSDQDALDSTLPTTFASLMNNLCFVAFAVRPAPRPIARASGLLVFMHSPAVCTMAIVAPLLLPLLALAALLYYRIQARYRCSSRELKRLDSGAKSPILVLVTETLAGAGLATTRAFRAADRCVALMHRRLDGLNAYYKSRVPPPLTSILLLSLNSANRWMGLRLDFLGAATVLASGTLAAASRAMGSSSISAGLAGLLVTSALNVTSSCTWVVRRVPPNPYPLAPPLPTHSAAAPLALSFLLPSLDPPPPRLLPAPPSTPLPPLNQPRCPTPLPLPFLLDTASPGASGQVRYATDTEMQMTCAERVVEYCTALPAEAAEFRAGGEAPAGWPAAGRVDLQNLTVSLDSAKVYNALLELQNLTVSYDGAAEPALRGVSAQLEAGAKVGICGRTGSGKSTMALALFRLLEPAAGRVVRPAPAPPRPAPPQKPLKPTDGLSSPAPAPPLTPAPRPRPRQLVDGVAEGGSNLSTGQRQLLCLARALLRRCRVLVLDEATASVDVHTDAVIQKTVREEFRDATVLTIAHRLETIADADRVLVLERGRVVEAGPPRALLADPASRFARMARRLAPATSTSTAARPAPGPALPAPSALPA
eukprot:tig00020592_g11632.t1